MPRTKTAAPATEPEVITGDDDQAQAARVADANARIDKTLGEHLEDAQNRAQKIPWKHEIGSSVLLLTEGQEPRKAVLRNITDSGAFAHYDLNMADGGTVDGVEAWRIGRDLDAEGENARLREQLALHERHHQRGRDLSQRYLEQRAEEARMAEVLSKHKKKIQETVEELAEHNRKDPNQLELQDAIAAATAEYPAGEDKPAATIAARVAAGDAISLAELPFGIDALHSARFEQATLSTGKPQQVKPLGFQDEDYLLTDVQDGVAVLLPIHEQKEWLALYEETFGPPYEIPADVPSDDDGGGKLCGMPVKVGRRTRYIGPSREALLIRLPPNDAKTLHVAGLIDDALADDDKPTGKDAAAGD